MEKINSLPNKIISTVKLGDNAFGSIRLFVGVCESYVKCVLSSHFDVFVASTWCGVDRNQYLIKNVINASVPDFVPAHFDLLLQMKTNSFLFTKYIFNFQILGY